MEYLHRMFLEYETRSGRTKRAIYISVATHLPKVCTGHYHEATVVRSDIVQPDGDASNHAEVGGSSVASPEQVLLLILAARDNLTCVRQKDTWRLRSASPRLTGLFWLQCFRWAPSIKIPKAILNPF
jgi:hypothetical protein